MKRLYLFFLFVFLTLNLSGQTINFPDATFKAKLLEPNVVTDEVGVEIMIDINNDGEIQVSEAQRVFAINVSNSGISDLTGISNFINLKRLICDYNLITTIAIDNVIRLHYLSASHNQLTSFEAHFGSWADLLDLSYNNLVTLDIGNSYFADFDLSRNNLTNLTLRNSTFDYFSVAHNNLSSIQYVGNIQFLWPIAQFNNNQFSLLEFPSNVNFDNAVQINLGNNVVDNVYFHGQQPGNISYTSATNTRFDLGNFSMGRDCQPELQGDVTILNCPSLQEVSFKNGFNHTFTTCNEGGDIFDIPALNLQISDCPNLTSICVDQPETANFQQYMVELGLQNQVQINTACSALVLGLEESVSENQFTIYPVPAHNLLEIHSSENLRIKNIEIYNNLGQVVQKEVGCQQSVNVSLLAKGIYYLKIYTDGLTSIKKFLKS
ncbi:T9SS type A sorting domain-containing protein [Flavobacterium sp.]